MRTIHRAWLAVLGAACLLACGNGEESDTPASEDQNLATEPLPGKRPSPAPAVAAAGLAVGTYERWGEVASPFEKAGRFLRMEVGADGTANVTIVSTTCGAPGCPRKTLAVDNYGALPYKLSDGTLEIDTRPTPSVFSVKTIFSSDGPGGERAPMLLVTPRSGVIPDAGDHSTFQLINVASGQ